MDRAGQFGGETGRYFVSRPAGVNRHQTGLTEEGEGSIIDREPGGGREAD